MPRLELLCAVVLLLLSACAPRTVGTVTVARPDAFSAAFSPRGVLWVTGGTAFLARAPQFRVEKLATPVPVADVAWHDGDAWAALPSVALVVRLTGTGGSLQAGVAVKLSESRIYREDGTALTYSGESTAGLTGAPDAVVTGGDGLDYALQGERLYRIGRERSLVGASQGGPFLTPSPGGVLVSSVPSAVTRDFTYQLHDGQLLRQDASRTVRGAVPHLPGRVGLVGDLVVTVTREGQVRVFRYDLTEVKP
ncbi:hypothetical protein [Deinococcus peraridilitoris]|uniref:Lipoprotein n=1 Tax=Deinococcus peraridilitoris (strain DSM 19664 / LMG 22246 / CIP 109416 / KR-200) TaxID=937777 RepID=K9ZW53_DEIPD|nr:hypothetical protein [Deinococcus peraridilitoris]AFZ65796.1 hypothetical protein Deipe_0193 [Deinococcus peraridilitoris DSM 19664]